MRSWMRTNVRLMAAALVVAAVGNFCVQDAPAAKIEPPGRVLPEYIKRIYIREFKNESRKFGAQADLTLFVNDEFMSDGRLDVVQNERADVRMEGKIKTYMDMPTGSSGDRIPVVSTISMVCQVELWDPYDSDRVVPIASYTVPAQIQYISDARRSISETETEAKERIMRQMAKNIVQQVLTGAPDPLREVEKRAVIKYQQRNNPVEREPVMSRPRYPKPTPGRTTR